MTPIEVERLDAAYDIEPALRGVSWRVEAGEFWAVVGPNGSGKSTLLKTVLGLLRPRSGAVRLFGRPPARFSEWRRVGYLPQFSGNLAANFPATVREVVALGRLATRRFPRLGGCGDAAAVDAALAQFDIADLAHRPIGELSGGQRQRALLARAFVNRPELLLLDEPNAALDPVSREDFYGLLRRLHREAGATIVLVTHDSAEAGRHADRLLYLDREVVFSGSFEDFCRSPEMAARFGFQSQHVICHQHDVPERRP